MKIREMTIADYPDIIFLLRETPGISVRDADAQSATEIYLRRNPGLNFVATLNGNLVGCVMCGHDGRRGYLQHLAVRPEYRNRGAGARLIETCIAALQEIGICKTHIFVFKTNAHANDYWSAKGWQLREELNMYSYNASPNENA